jgi:hypothetical protein
MGVPDLFYFSPILLGPFYWSGKKLSSGKMGKDGVFYIKNSLDNLSRKWITFSRPMFLIQGLLLPLSDFWGTSQIFPDSGKLMKLRKRLNGHAGRSL